MITELNNIPEYVSPIWENNRLVNRDALKWSGKTPPPVIGQSINVNKHVVNVLGYFVQENWLGVRVAYAGGVDYIFGAEISA